MQTPAEKYFRDGLMTSTSRTYRALTPRIIGLAALRTSPFCGLARAALAAVAGALDRLDDKPPRLPLVANALAARARDYTGSVVVTASSHRVFATKNTTRTE
jgi:hypothetical protein